MTETFAALFLAHVLADFVFQTRGMVARKNQPLILLLHAAIVLVLTLAAVGRLDAPLLYLVAASHLVIDGLKVRFGRGLAGYMADQGAHLAILLGVSLVAPGLWSGGIWPAHPTPVPLPALMLVVAGAIFATRAGDFATGLLVSGFAARSPLPSDGLPGAGEVIGLLERGLTYAFILLGQFEAVGFLLAAKSILRFGAIREDRAASEYVLIGSLASFGWAILTGFAIRTLLERIAGA